MTKREARELLPTLAWGQLIDHLDDIRSSIAPSAMSKVNPQFPLHAAWLIYRRAAAGRAGPIYEYHEITGRPRADGMIAVNILRDFGAPRSDR